MVDDRQPGDKFCCYLKTNPYFLRIQKMTKRESGGASYLRWGVGLTPPAGPTVPGYSSLVNSIGTPLDAPNNDLRHYCNTNVPDCTKSCDDDVTCAGFSFRYDDYDDKGGKNCCYLKSKISDDVSALTTFQSDGGRMGFTYRKVASEGYQTLTNSDFSGNDLPGNPVREATVDSCRQACNSKGSSCAGFVFGDAPWDGCFNCCYLKFALTTRGPSSGQTTYKKLYPTAPAGFAYSGSGWDNRGSLAGSPVCGKEVEGCRDACDAVGQQGCKGFIWFAKASGYSNGQERCCYLKDQAPNGYLVRNLELDKFAFAYSRI